jgi:hypothetical protein
MPRISYCRRLLDDLKDLFLLDAILQTTRLEDDGFDPEYINEHLRDILELIAIGAPYARYFLARDPRQTHLQHHIFDGRTE